MPESGRSKVNMPPDRRPAVLAGCRYGNGALCPVVCGDQRYQAQTGIGQFGDREFSWADWRTAKSNARAQRRFGDPPPRLAVLGPVPTAAGRSRLRCPFCQKLSAADRRGPSSTMRLHRHSNDLEVMIELKILGKDLTKSRPSPKCTYMSYRQR
jgi:hypothetical protein